MARKRTRNRRSPGAAADARPPTVYLIAGPNGAGKTTFATEFLPRFVDCREFLNADLIAAGLAPFAPETQNVRAARLLLTRIRELAEIKRDFGFETTLAGRSYVRILSDMKNRGYRVQLFFLGCRVPIWPWHAWWIACGRAATMCRSRTFVEGLRLVFSICLVSIDRWPTHAGCTMHLNSHRV
jgi:hypothetical protein